MSLARAAVVVLVASVCALPPAMAQPAPSSMNAEARALLDHGLALYDTQRYAEAIAEFQRGYELSRRPEFLFAIGQARRLSGDCPGAILAFESFLRKSPPATQEKAAEDLIAQCKAAQPPRPVQPVAPAIATEPPSIEAQPPSPRRHVATAIFGGTAIAALVAATAFELSASSRYNSLLDSCAPPRGMGCGEDQISSLSSRIDLATGLFVTSGVLAVATLVAWYVERARPQATSVRVTGRGLAFEF